MGMGGVFFKNLELYLPLQLGSGEYVNGDFEYVYWFFFLHMSTCIGTW